MDRRIESWHSPAVDRELSVARWGWWGRPVIFFPTGGGDALDCERFGMVRALSGLLEAGRIKLYAVDSLSRESWIDPSVPPAEKVARQARYDAWLTGELVPWIRADCEGDEQPMVVTGASIGAFLAWSAAARHPTLFSLMIGMSGTYQMDRRMSGHWDESWYFLDPCQFVPNLPEGRQLAQLRESLFVFGLGRQWENPTYTANAARALAARSIPHHVEQWGGDSGHDWPTWRTMLPAALRRLA
jgi:esterase/lipase superfamily enzyme